MPVLNFKSQFVLKIQCREKTHTIRDKRKIPIEVGDKLYLFTGMRTKHCKRILTDPVICTKVEEIEIIADADIHAPGAVWIDRQMLDNDEKEQLARRDGFENFADMIRFWDGRLPFVGDIIHWKEK